MKTAKQWITQLDLADKREKDWRTESKAIWERYRAKKLRKNNFNILWSNTEVIAPAVYNSMPRPDVRRRFKDDDPLGKAVSQVQERCLDFNTDCTPFNAAMESAVLDMLLPGRGVIRVKYVPTLAELPSENSESNEEEPDAETGDANIALTWEQAYPEHVKWEDFRIGPGKCWEELTWIAFRHDMGREELERLFKEKGKAVKLDQPQDQELREQKDEGVCTAEIWEIWDKDTRKIVFISKTQKDDVMGEFADELEIDGFFPTPRPMYVIGDPNSLIPITLYSQYKEQAEELDRVSGRINKIMDAIRARGVYDATIKELDQIMSAGDNQLIPSQGAAAFMNGGLDKAIWFMPIQILAVVLKELYTQREACKNVIYELIGIGDIMRGMSNPNETLGAQQLKTQWGGQRLQKWQREVQRYARDLMRIMGQIIGEKFASDTVKAMCQLQFPTDQEVKMQAAKAAQMAVQQAPGAAQTPPQPPPITWEQIFAELKNNADRAYRIDIETDSTIAANIQQDMEGIQQVLTALGQFLQSVMPMVESGILPMEAVKQIAMQICRRSKMGSSVEDALDKIQQPQPKPDPKMQEAQAKLSAKQQTDQAKIQADMQKSQIQIQAEAQLEQARMNMEAQLEQQKHSFEAQARTAEQASEARLKAVEMAHEERFQTWKAQLDGAVKIMVAEITAKAKEAVAEQAASQTVAADMP